MKLFTKYVRALLTVAVVGIGYVSDVAARGAVKTTTFADLRDGQKYRSVKIGNQLWMAENLRFEIGDSWCYDDKKSNCKKYGRLYDWNMAKVACPAGWHLPTEAEWDSLENAAGGNVPGKKLKATSGWNENGNGTDEFGFSALPGGTRDTDGSFGDAGYAGYWWTATEGGSSYAYYWGIGYYGGYMGESSYGKGIGFSVRCIAD
jgi:uncharacterized protein (TIGR02145 family)